MKSFCVKAIIFLGLVSSILCGADPYMSPYTDSFVIHLHGINSDRYTWYQAKEDGSLNENGSPEQWMNYLNKELVIPRDRLISYSFSKMSGYHARNMLELGGVGYKSEGGDSKAENNQDTVAMNDGTVVPKRTGIEIGTTRTWLEQAKADYKKSLFDSETLNPKVPGRQVWQNEKDIPDALLPSKLVMLAHSQGNFAVRGYIQSGALARGNDYFGGVPDNLLSPQEKAKIKESPLGFYHYPVSKVVFINPTLRGGEIHTYLMLRVVSNLKRLSELKVLNGINIGGKDTKVGEIIGDLGAIALASDEKALTELAASDVGKWAMTPFEIKGTPIGDVKKTNAEVFVVVTDLLIEQMTKTGMGPLGLPNLMSWFQLPGQKSGSGVTWAEFLASLKRLFPDIDPERWTDYIVKGDIPPIKGIGNPFDSFAKSLEQDDIPGISYMKGLAYLAKESRAKSLMMSGMIDTGFVNASEESVGNLQHVGPGGTEKMLLDKTLEADLEKLPGNLADNQRKWQPKYRIISSEGSIATDPKLTRMAFAADAGVRVANNLGVNMSLGVPILGFDLEKDPYMTMTIMNDDFWKLKRSQQFYAMAASQLGGVFTKAGDIVVSNESLRGEGVRELQENGVAVYRRENPSTITQPLDDALTTILAIDSLMLAIRFNPICPVEIPAMARGWVRAGVYLNYGVQMGMDVTQGLGDLISPKKDKDGVPKANPMFRDLAKHLMVMGYAKSEGHTPDMDKSLYEPPKIIMDGLYGELDTQSSEKRGISQGSVTANYVATIAELGKPVTKFSALPESNWAGVKFTWPSYERVVGTTTPNEVIARGVTVVSTNGQLIARKLFYERIPTFNVESGGDQSMLVKDSRYEYEQPISAVSLGNESVVLRGSLMDFTPRHPETVLEYSSNFSGWAKVPILNDYGHFELGPIKLYEGQNVIAFRAKNRADYSSNQILKILKTGITLQPVLDEIQPKEESITNDNRPIISLAYQNMKYSDSAANKITLDSLVVSTGNATGNEVIANVTQKQVIRDTVNRLEVNYHPATALPDGTYYVTAKARDAYNTSSFIRYGFTIDTVSPVVTIAPITPINPNLSVNKPVAVEVTVTDNGNFIVKKQSLSVKKLNGDTIYTAETEDVSVGVTTFEWVPTASLWADGRYEVNVEVTDLAGNKGSAIQYLCIDRSPPEIVDISGMTGVYTQATANAESRIMVNEEVKAVIIIRNSKGEIVHQSAMTPVGARFIAPTNQSNNGNITPKKIDVPK